MGVLFGHEPVMPVECVDGLNIREGGVIADCTAGGAGHMRRVAEELRRLGGGRVIGVDRDETAVLAACSALADYADMTEVVHGNFEFLPEILDKLGIEGIDGALMDLGVSSYQLDTPERGFSFTRDGPLDMRMDARSRLTARTIVNDKPLRELERIIKEYGEERFAKRIAGKIDAARLRKPIETTLELADVVRSAIPREFREAGQHPATRTFQAIRIACNDELGAIERAIPKIIGRLNPGGRMCVITFHSLEDRIVKAAFKKAADPCECPKEYPCVCGLKPAVRLITKKPLTPSKTEAANNPRSRSAKLRIIEKL